MIFSPQDYAQEVVALAIAVVAAIYIAGRLIGWPKAGKKTDEGPPVHTSRRLARGLARAARHKAEGS